MAGLPNRFGANDSPKPQDGPKFGGLASWCMAKVREGRDDRDERYEARWKLYTRLWRGFWDPKDKNADSERSKIISPATQQAIEMTVSEMEEAVFTREAWFDIDDDIADEDKADAIAARDMLLEEFALNNVEQAVTEAFLLSAIYGTGILKMNVQKVREPRIDGEFDTRVAVMVEAVRPDQFVIDPTALNINEAAYIAHEMVKPRHSILEKQSKGVYGGRPVGRWNGERYAAPDGTDKWSHVSEKQDGVLITEFIGKVPAGMLPGGKGTELVEAIVTIANETEVLKARANPFRMKDRPFVAFRFDVVPGEFWGRGVAEKGMNPQRALDTELRARADALAFMNAPMMGADITRLPRNTDLRARPGKTILGRGSPSEIFAPITWGNEAVLNSTYQQTSDLERMVTMATGAMDSAIPIGQNRRNETASGMSMMGQGFVKRSKRAMRRVEKECLQPLIRKALWRYIQFDPQQRFAKDYKFLPKATMGIMAKEVENAQLTNMLGYLEPGTQEHKLIVKAIFDNTSSSANVELRKAMEAMTAPPPPEVVQAQQAAQKAELERLMKEVEKLASEAEENLANAEKLRADAYHTLIVADLEDDKVGIMAANAVTGAEKVRKEGERNQVEREKARSQRRPSD